MNLKSISPGSDRVFVAVLLIRAVAGPSLQLLEVGRSPAVSSVSGTLLRSGETTPAAAAVALIGSFVLVVLSLIRIVGTMDRPLDFSSPTWAVAALAAWMCFFAGGPSFPSPWLIAGLLAWFAVALSPLSIDSVVGGLVGATYWFAFSGLTLAAVDSSRALLSDGSRLNLLGGRLAGLASHPNELGFILAIGIQVILWRRRRVSKASLGVGVVVVLAALLATGSRTALLAAGIGAVVTLRKDREPSRRRYQRRRLLAWALFAFSTLPVFLSPPDALVGVGRPELWDFARSAWAQQSFLGGGVTVWSRLSSEGRLPFDYGFHAHNLWLDLLMAGGVVALLLGLVWIVRLVRACYSSQTEASALLTPLVVVVAATALAEVPLYFGSIDMRFVLALLVSSVASLNHAARGRDVRPHEGGVQEARGRLTEAQMSSAVRGGDFE